ncbi:MAG: CbiX/SirB N-terminal domain-containing protein [Acidobacteriota bacterium]|nr:CbiX/SirB N-terminal domain-containing protein [Acidobacteriota bacterium]
MNTGIVVFAHGSSVASANDAVREIAARANFPLYETAFLDSAEPNLAEAVRRLTVRGASGILVIPYFLTLGLHLQRDLPAIVRELSDIYKDVEIRVAPPLDGHPALSNILVDRAREAFGEGKLP